MEKRERNDGGVGDRVCPAVGVVGIVFLFELFDRLVIADAALIVRENLRDLRVESGRCRNVSETAADDILDIVGDSRAGDHGSGEHFAVNAVFDV